MPGACRPRRSAPDVSVSSVMSTAQVSTRILGSRTAPFIPFLFPYRVPHGFTQDPSTDLALVAAQAGANLATAGAGDLTDGDGTFGALQAAGVGGASAARKTNYKLWTAAGLAG